MTMLRLSEVKHTRLGGKRNYSAADLLLNYGFYLGILCLMAFFATQTSSFLKINNLLSITTQAGYLIVVSFGVMMTILTGGIDLSVGAVLAFSCIIGATVMQITQNIVLGILVILLVATFCGFLNGLVVAVLKFPPFIATMAMMSVTRGLSLFITKGESVSGLPSGYRKIGWNTVGPIPVTLIIALVVFLLMWFLLKRTAYGRKIYAVGGNARAANIVGIHVAATIITAYAISGFMAGLGGVLLSSRLSAARSIMADDLQMDAIAAVVIGGTSLDGGRGSIVGTLVGACLIAIIRNGLNLMQLDYYYQLVTTGAIIIIAVAIDCIKKMRNN